MIEKNISCSHTSYVVIDINGRAQGIRKARDYKDYFEHQKSCNIGLSTVIIERNLLKKKFRFPTIKTKEDFVLWLKLVKSGHPIIGIKKNLAKWRKSNNSLSSSFFQKIKDGFKVYNYYLNYSIFKSFYYLIILSINFLKKSLIKS